MSRIQSFEGLKVWQKARELNIAVYQASNTGKFVSDYALKDQIRRASISVLSNIAEGFERRNKKEFYKFLSYAKGSAGEVRAQLYVALDLNYISQQEFQKLNELSAEISRMINGLMTYIKQDIKVNI